MNETKLTKATIRVMNSYQWGNFESSLTIENENGIMAGEIDTLGMQAQEQVNILVENYKALNNIEIKSKPVVNNSRIADIEKLPMYKEIKNKIPPAANHKEFERMTYLINDCITIKELMKLKKDVPVELNDIFNQKFAEIGDATNEK